MKISIDDKITTSEDNVKVNIESDDSPCILESINYENDCIEDDNDEVYLDYEPNITYKSNLGKITVFDKLDHINGVEVEGAQINLYKLSAINPTLVETKMTDSNGKAEFSDLDEGNYRVIAIVDKRFFLRPDYYRWNEININSTNKEDTVIVVNKIKPEYKNNYIK